LHRMKIIYRDLKPDNIMVNSDGHVKLIDFGFAKKLKGEMRTLTNCGTLGYAAPEVVNGASVGYSFAADVWSFGIMLAELLLG
jgi:serine/threonine protein kinase